MKTGGVGAAKHEDMAGYFTGFLADALEEFVNNQLDRAYYEAVAWGGLTGTKYFDGLSQSRKNQINNRVLIEQTSRNANGDYRAPKGDDSGC